MELDPLLVNCGVIGGVEIRIVSGFISGAGKSLVILRALVFYRRPPCRALVSLSSASTERAADLARLIPSFEVKKRLDD